jgi:hypothetical protein
MKRKTILSVELQKRLQAQPHTLDERKEILSRRGLYHVDRLPALHLKLVDRDGMPVQVANAMLTAVGGRLTNPQRKACFAAREEVLVSTRTKKPSVQRLDEKLARATFGQLITWNTRAIHRAELIQPSFEHAKHQSIQAPAEELQARMLLVSERLGMQLMQLHVFRARTEEQIEHRSQPGFRGEGRKDVLWRVKARAERNSECFRHNS